MTTASILYDAWAMALWQACWQGGFLVLAVWLICRVIPSMPAKYRCWFWRLAILKFMIVLLCPTLLNLPLLSAPSVAIPFPAVGVHVATDMPITREPPASPMDHVRLTPNKVIELPSVRAILCFAWIIGVGWSLARLLIDWHRARQLRKQGHIIDCVPLIEQLAIQARLFGLRGSPELLEVPGCGSPMLIGMFRPAIVIPTETYRRLTAAERTMVLGHELAHIRRGDLLWRFIAVCVRATFFFHPLVWLSHWRLSLAQEMAADQLAIAQQECDPVSYGKLLVAVVEKIGSRRLIPSLSVGTMEPVESLTRRLVAMMSVNRVSRRMVVSSAVLLTATVLLGVVPWRLVAAEPKEGEKVSSSAAENSAEGQVGPTLKSANDAKNLQGTWQAVYLEANGEKSPADQMKELKIVFKGDEVFAVQPEGEGQKCKFKLGTSKTLNTIDLIPLDKGKAGTGIYSLKNGRLRLCVHLFGKDTTQRPTEFKTRAGDGVGFAILERAADDKSANDAKDLQGVWQAVDLEGNGEKLPADQVKELKIVFKGDEVFVVKTSGEDPKNKFKLDPGKTPKTIDVIPIDGSDKGTIHAGIYSLKNGRLTLCLNIFGKDPALRPAEFKTKASDGVGLITLERSKVPPAAR
ncbi:MAG: TIGR03067 domain-containing protein [Thermoguttaceae bacterium]